MTPATPLPTPNHHAAHPPFAGPSGLIATLSMVAGRGDMSRLACDRVGLEPGDRVVDIGCGPGAAAREAARRGASVIGVDPAAVMLAVARRLTARTSPVEWKEGVAERLPVADGSASVVWALSTVHHWQDVDAGLREIRRVLSPAGRFLAIERRAREGATGHASHGWIPAQADALAAACEAAGLADVSVDERQVGRGQALVVLGTRR